jgi:glycosyltransferase involved in cell wall biosynthesis
VSIRLAVAGRVCCRRVEGVIVVMPARNEAASLGPVVAELRTWRADVEILVVDDASDDATRTVLPALGVRWLRLIEHLGVGGAVRAGLRYARQLGYAVVVRMDADGQHRPLDLDALVAPILAGTADAVCGSRYHGGRRRGFRSPWSRRLTQRLVAAYLSIVTRRRITDPTSGLWAFGPAAIDLLVDHHPMGYPEPELQLLLSRAELRVLEVPVEMRGRIAGRSSLDGLRTIAAAARVLLAFAVVPFRKVGGRVP